MLVRFAPEPRRRHVSGGFSLLEVMVAALLVALGLLSLGVLLGVSVRNSHVATLHQQATSLAHSMMDRMASNTQGVWLGGYESPAGGFTPLPGFASTCNDVSPCDAAALAARDVRQWRAELAQLLSEDATPRGSVSCQAYSPVPSNLAARPIFDGLCTLTLSWIEHDATGAPRAVELAWRFRP
jgi:type IV pilus modification protein PilV